MRMISESVDYLHFIFKDVVAVYLMGWGNSIVYDRHNHSIVFSTPIEDF